MKKMIKMLPALGMVLAAVFTFAFTNATVDYSQQYGTPDNGTTWYDVTNVEMGPGPDRYQCDEQEPNEEEQCLYSAESTGSPIPDSNGLFVPGANLIPE